MNPTWRSHLARLSLLGATLIWGVSFVIVKNTTDTVPPHILLGIRFTIGCLLLSLIFLPRLRRTLSLDYIKKGAVMGALLFGAYSLQTVGITMTTPGKNAFLTAVYCVLVPFVFWVVYRRRPDRYNILAALLCIVGIGCVSLDSGLTIGMGDALTLACGVFYAVHIVAVARFTATRDPIVLTIVQFGCTALLSWAVGLLFEDFPTVWPQESLVGILYLGIGATAAGLLLQIIGQKYTDPSAAAIILSLEAVFGVIFSILLYHEAVTPRLILGFALIFLAVLTSETKLAFLRRKKAAPAPKEGASGL